MDNQNPYAAPSSTEMDDSSWRPPIDGTIFATRWERFAGNFLDYLLIVLALIPVAIVFFLIFPSLADQATEDPGMFNTNELLVLIVFYVAMFATLALMNGYLLAARGQTVGKFLMKTQILTEDDKIPPVVRVLLIRYLLIWLITSIPGLGNIFSFANALAVFRENHKCIHDEICKTKVVKYRPPVHGQTFG